MLDAKDSTLNFDNKCALAAHFTHRLASKLRQTRRTPSTSTHSTRFACFVGSLEAASARATRSARHSTQSLRKRKVEVMVLSYCILFGQCHTASNIALSYCNYRSRSTLFSTIFLRTLQLKPSLTHSFSLSVTISLS